MRGLVGLVIAVVILTACGSSGGGEADDPAAEQASAAGGTAAALAAVTVLRDEAAASEQLIGPEGGSLTATAADGTTFALTVPPGALPSETTIRAVPSALEGVDFPTHTVMFEPTGLEFMDWATLAITPATDIPVAEQFMYRLNDDATEFGAAFMGPASASPIIYLDHFSGYGLGAATDAQRAAILATKANDAELRISSDIADVMASMREVNEAGESAENMVDSLEALAREYEEQVVKSRLEAAGSSCEAKKEAIRTVLGYERQRQLLGLGSSPNVDAMQILNDAVASDGGPCEEEAIRQCKAAKDPGILIAYWLGMERTRQLLGNEGSGLDITSIIKKARDICAPAAYEAFEQLPSAPSGTTVQGLICSLAEPFTVRWTGDYTGRMRFTPSSKDGGNYTFKANAGLIKLNGAGPYTVVYDSTGLATSIDFDFVTTMTVPNVSSETTSEFWSLKLTPAAPCAEQQ
jgi:hypothetical protein